MKYQGNKQRFVGDILPIMLKEMENCNAFVDIFCGSCSVIQKVPNKYVRIANDKNKYLIAMWKDLIDGKNFPTMITKKLYDEIRGCVHWDSDKYSEGLIGWCGFMASFNGRFVDGGYSGHNVKGSNGKTRDYIRENIQNTLPQIEELKGVKFYSGDYQDVKLPEKSLIYCDPPYKGTKQYYTSKDFDYERFYKWLRDKKEEGHTIFVSEYDMPGDFTVVWEKDVKVAQNPTKTKKSTEKLFRL